MSLDKGNLKTGFWVGLGVVLALAVWGFLQMLLLRITEKRNG